ncbi:uncharacterized protein LOC131987192 [Centropristis striata]|uniref:uncharacterized protein LOC131987192 n=1 Tax=Centropristis striata TaxID=184440 RepID=UPI0027E1332F|nr:uncharacterized protein LOC131987192 [Centropristis striata]
MENIDEYIWQRRIHHGVRYQKSDVPFPKSVQIGLDFNAALERTEKLDLSLLTNGVMLELCDFAKAVTRSEKYFLFEMLEFNFDLCCDPDDDRQFYRYTTRISAKMKQLREQFKTKPSKWKESFPLPDLSFILKFPGPEEPERYYPKRNKSIDISVLTNSNKNRQSAEHQKTESNGSLFIRKGRGGGRYRTKGTYPFCRDLGVTFCVRTDGPPKEKLDRSLVSIGVMMELLSFSKVLSGSQPGIVHDLIKQNFGYELDKRMFQMHRTKLMERKYACLIHGGREDFQKEVFNITVKRQKQRRKKPKEPDADNQDLASLIVAGKRRATLRLRNGDEDFYQDTDLSYMCPVDFETDMQSGSETNFQCESLSDVKQEEEKVLISQPQMFSVRPKKTTLKVSDLFSEDKTEATNVKTHKQKLWMRRALRSKEILKSSRINDMFAHCRERGLDFNVGSGNKQNLDPQILTNHVWWEVHKFATTMTKSLRSFLLEILHNNFTLVLQDEIHQQNFMTYIIKKEKILQNHPDAKKMEFLHSPFQFPEVYNMIDVTTDFEAGQEAEAEQQTDWDPPPSSATSQVGDEEQHQFCKNIGLDLWSAEERLASQKLDLAVLTTGAVLEVFGFIRVLCGSVREIVTDVLEHNFDLDLSGETKASQVVQRWYSSKDCLMKRITTSPKITRWLNMVVPLSGIKQGMETSDEYEEKKINSYHICEKIGLDLNVRSKQKAKTKLDLRVLTRGVLLEMHRYVERHCNRYVPALYEILEYNFDLSSQNHRKVEFAWSTASQVLSIAAKHDRKGGYLNKVVELPIEVSKPSEVICKEEPDDDFGDLDLNDNDVLFVRELKPVDIEVEIE